VFVSLCSLLITVVYGLRGVVRRPLKRVTNRRGEQGNISLSCHAMPSN